MMDKISPRKLKTHLNAKPVQRRWNGFLFFVFLFFVVVVVVLFFCPIFEFGSYLLHSLRGANDHSFNCLPTSTTKASTAQ